MIYVARAFSPTVLRALPGWMCVMGSWEVFSWGSLAPVTQPRYSEHSSVVPIHVQSTESSLTDASFVIAGSVGQSDFEGVGKKKKKSPHFLLPHLLILNRETSWF